MATKERLQTEKRTKLGLTLLTLISLLASDQAPRDQRQINREIAQGLGTTIKIGVEETRKFVGDIAGGTSEFLSKNLVELDKYLDTTYFVFKETEKLDFEATVKIYKYVASRDNLLRKFDAIPTTEQLERWEYDMYARAISLGFASRDKKFIPLQWVWFTWEKHLFAYAETNCLENTVQMNAALDPRIPGLYYPLGKEYLAPGTFVTMGHETIHQYGDVCRIFLVGAGSVFQYTGLVDNGVERTAQIGALEIITSMANDGESVAISAASHLLREITFRAMVYEGLNKGRLSELIAVLREMGEDPFTIGKVERMFADANKYPFLKAQFKLGLEQYGYSPLQVIIESAKHPDHETKKLLKMGKDGLLHFEPHQLENIHFFLSHQDEFTDYLKTLIN